MRASTDAGVGYKLPGPLVAFINTLLSSFTHYRLDQKGSLISVPKPPATLLDLQTQLPGDCATAKQAAPQ